LARSVVRLGAYVIACLLALAACSQAAAAAVYEVPAEIPDDCSVSVENQVMAWLATVPDGNTARFAAGACYGQDGTITLTGRSGLVIDGQGAEFRALTMGGAHRANWRFFGGANLAIQNVAVRGTNPAGGYTAGFEWQHGFSVEGVQGMTLANVEARETWGDGIYLDHGVASPACGDDASSARNVVITGATLERSGRQGVAVVDAEHVTVQDSAIGPVALANVDLETDDDCGLARHITIARNQFGAHSWGVVDSVGFGANPQVGDVTVTDNTESVAASGCFAPIRILSPVVPEGQPRVYRHDYTFTGNRLRGTRNGFEFRGLRNVEVSSNSVNLPATVGCGTRAGVLLVDSHTVAIRLNSFVGANSVFKVDALSTGITTQGNTTAPPNTSIASGPEGNVGSTSASFAFSSNAPHVSFECRVDGGAFAGCTSPQEYAQLPDGAHTFEVRAVDPFGNRDLTPASRTWTVDTVAPLVTLDQPAPGSTTDDPTPDLSGAAGNQPGDSTVVTMRIWLGSSATGSPLQSKAINADSVTRAYSVTADTLADGTYTARAEQSDLAGNSGKSSLSTFTIDTAAPEGAPADTGVVPEPSPPTDVTAPVTALLAPPPDVTPPVVELGGRRTQVGRRTVKVRVKPTSENVWATASGKVAIRGSTRSYRLKGVVARFIASGDTATLKLEMSRTALRAVTHALDRDRRPRAELKLSLRDAAGNITTKRRTIRLKR
jgi:hypothetical protein